jgi:diaminopimelate decarboxylase
MPTNTFRTNFLTRDQAEVLAREHSTPLYAYSEAALREQAAQTLAIDAPFGLTVRYAMKANPNADVLRVLREQGIAIDASSGYEAEEAIAQGFAPLDILLTSQELPKNLKRLVGQGVQFTACSLRQLEVFCQTFGGGTVGVRLNPGLGSGHSQKTNVGGVTSSFGIWHDYVPQVQELAAKHDVTITRVHTHIGSGTDPAVWAEAIERTLELVERFPDVTVVDVGGGFKIGRMDGDKSTDMKAVGQTLREHLLAFAERTGRQLHLEIEPGTFLVANAGIIVARVEDVTDTGPEGFKFIKLNTGMTEILRPSLYAAQHPIAVLSDAEPDDFVVVGHCCESGDLLTPDPADPEKLATRNLPTPQVGDVVLIGGAGAYCASQSAAGYNAFPRAKELLV